MPDYIVYKVPKYLRRKKMKKLLAILFPLILIIFLLRMPMAAKIPTPTEPPAGVKIISINEANQLLHQKDVYVFDMRKELNYGKGHIPGAVSLPYIWTKNEHPNNYTGKFDSSRLPTDNNCIIIFHGDGPEEWNSYYTSKIVKEAGYKNVMWLRDGYSTWANKGYAVEH
jgi:rhodanese-related sulfurtransferase